MLISLRPNKCELFDINNKTLLLIQETFEEGGEKMLNTLN